MATCKDCLHEKVCDALIKSGCPYLDEEIPADAFCMVFKNKADVVPKSEVAREIFGRIYKKLKYYERYRILNDIIDNFFTLLEEVELEYKEDQQ